MPKRPTSVRLPDMTIGQLTELITQTGMTQSEIITTAIDRMFQQEKQTMNTEQIARERVRTTELNADRDILIDYDWDNMTEHWQWLATANLDEIKSWVRTIREAENAVSD